MGGVVCGEFRGVRADRGGVVGGKVSACVA